MTASDIVQIAVTVGVIQAICDLIARWRIYSKASYERALGELSRAEQKLERERAAVEASKSVTSTDALSKTKSSKNPGKKESAASSSSKAEKLAKRLQRAEDDYSDALAVMTQKHTFPSFMISLVFFILLRVLGIEYKGRIIAVLPFVPYSFVQRLTSRGIEWKASLDGERLPFENANDKVDNVGQACSFIFIYLLTTMSVKFYVGKILGTPPPHGAESILSMVNSPKGQRALKKLGVDPADLQIDETKKK